jgi:sensor histidine kinase YesM
MVYCIAVRDGGQGIPKLEAQATSTALQQGITLLNSLDSAIHALVKATKLEQKLQSLAKAIRLP